MRDFLWAVVMLVLSMAALCMAERKRECHGWGEADDWMPWLCLSVLAGVLAAGTLISGATSVADDHRDWHVEIGGDK